MDDFVEKDIYGRGADVIFGKGAAEITKRQALLKLKAIRDAKAKIKPGEYVEYDLYGRGDPRIFGKNAHIENYREAAKELARRQRPDRFSVRKALQVPSRAVRNALKLLGKRSAGSASSFSDAQAADNEGMSQFSGVQNVEVFNQIGESAQARMSDSSASKSDPSAEADIAHPALFTKRVLNITTDKHGFREAVLVEDFPHADITDDSSNDRAVENLISAKRELSAEPVADIIAVSGLRKLFETKDDTTQTYVRIKEADRTPSTDRDSNNLWRSKSTLSKSYSRSGSRGNALTASSAELSFPRSSPRSVQSDEASQTTEASSPRESTVQKHLEFTVPESPTVDLTDSENREENIPFALKSFRESEKSLSDNSTMIKPGLDDGDIAGFDSKEDILETDRQCSIEDAGQYDIGKYASVDIMSQSDVERGIEADAPVDGVEICAEKESAHTSERDTTWFDASEGSMENCQQSNTQDACESAAGKCDGVYAIDHSDTDGTFKVDDGVENVAVSAENMSSHTFDSSKSFGTAADLDREPISNSVSHLRTLFEAKREGQSQSATNNEISSTPEKFQQSHPKSVETDEMENGSEEETCLSFSGRKSAHTKETLRAPTEVLATLFAPTPVAHTKVSDDMESDAAGAGERTINVLSTGESTVDSSQFKTPTGSSRAVKTLAGLFAKSSEQEKDGNQVSSSSSPQRFSRDHSVSGPLETFAGALDNSSDGAEEEELSVSSKAILAAVYVLDEDDIGNLTEKDISEHRSTSNKRSPPISASPSSPESASNSAQGVANADSWSSDILEPVAVSNQASIDFTNLLHEEARLETEDRDSSHAESVDEPESQGLGIDIPTDTAMCNENMQIDKCPIPDANSTTMSKGRSTMGRSMSKGFWERMFGFSMSTRHADEAKEEEVASACERAKASIAEPAKVAPCDVERLKSGAEEISCVEPEHSNLVDDAHSSNRENWNASNDICAAASENRISAEDAHIIAPEQSAVAMNEEKNISVAGSMTGNDDFSSSSSHTSDRYSAALRHNNATIIGEPDCISHEVLQYSRESRAPSADVHPIRAAVPALEEINSTSQEELRYRHENIERSVNAQPIQTAVPTLEKADSTSPEVLPNSRDSRVGSVDVQPIRAAVPALEESESTMCEILQNSHENIERSMDARPMQAAVQTLEETDSTSSDVLQYNHEDVGRSVDAQPIRAAVSALDEIDSTSHEVLQYSRENRVRSEDVQPIQATVPAPDEINSASHDVLQYSHENIGRSVSAQPIRSAVPALEESNSTSHEMLQNSHENIERSVDAQSMEAADPALDEIDPGELISESSSEYQSSTWSASSSALYTSVSTQGVANPDSWSSDILEPVAVSHQDFVDFRALASDRTRDETGGYDVSSGEEYEAQEALPIGDVNSFSSGGKISNNGESKSKGFWGRIFGYSGSTPDMNDENLGNGEHRNNSDCGKGQDDKVVDRKYGDRQKKQYSRGAGPSSTPRPTSGSYRSSNCDREAYQGNSGGLSDEGSDSYHTPNMHEAEETGAFIGQVTAKHFSGEEDGAVRGGDSIPNETKQGKRDATRSVSLSSAAPIVVNGSAVSVNRLDEGMRGYSTDAYETDTAGEYSVGSSDDYE